jgi:hypothetical protein
MEPESTAAADPQSIGVGDTVRLSQRPRYLKTADVMPMLRPPDLVDPEEQGQVVAIKAGDQRAVRFRRGTFLLTLDQLERLSC